MTPLALALALWAAPPAGSDGYGEALAAARGEAAAGRWQSAARLLEAPARTWPQDYPMQLERAWCLFQAGELGQATAGYRRARELAPEAVEPVLGLAWTALRRQDAARARRLFEEVLRRSPESASGREGLALLGPAHRGTLSLGGAFTSYQDPARPWLAAGSVAIDGVLFDRLALGGLYRLLGAQSTSAGGRGRSAGTSVPPQHEAHGALGWAGAGWSATIHGGWIGESVVDSGGTRSAGVEAGTLAGASAGLRPGAGLELDGAWLRTFYAGGDVTQWQATAGVALGLRWLLRAGVRGQQAPDGSGLAGLASLELRGPWSGWLAAELGRQRRPVDLPARAIYAAPSDLRWAARAGLGFPLGGPLSGLAALDLESWGPDAAGSSPSLAWRGGAALRLSF